MRADGSRDFIREFCELALRGHPLEGQEDKLVRTAESAFDSVLRRFDADPNDERVALSRLKLQSHTDDPEYRLEVVYARQMEPPQHDDPDHGHEHVCFEICIPIPWPDWPPYALLCIEICLPKPEGIFVPTW